MKLRKLAGSLRSIVVAATLILWSALSALAADVAALPFVSPMFGDNMVLQRGKPNTIWGWAKAGQEVRVTIADKSATAITKNDGRWSLQIQPPATGGPYTIVIDGPQHVEFHDVLVGDVWLCGGQSNMQMGLAEARNGSEEVKAANYPNIRLYSVKQNVAYTPVAVPQGSWKICSPQTIADRFNSFSAVGYFFGRRVQQDTHVPIGLIQDCVGGTPAEAWTSEQTLRTVKDFDAQLDDVARFAAKGAPTYGNFIAHWYDEYDKGQKSNAWFQVNFDDSDWKTVTIPGGFRELGVPETPALCYFRKTVVLPDPIPAGYAKILLGIVERMETTYVNGREVGASAWVENPRNYGIPGGVLKPGTNVVTVRVLKTKADGGFKSQAADLKLVVGQTEFPLAGDWKGKLSVDLRPPQPMPAGFENWPVMPAVLHNGMLAPVAPLAITGAIWYQGEQNSERAAQYRRLLPAMISDWRKTFGQGDFPFYIVSLAAYTPHKSAPSEDSWAELRESQDFVANTVTNSGLAVAIDVGDANNIHPKDKKEVGERLAALALSKYYGSNTPCEGPRFASMEKLPNALRLTFTHTEGGLVIKGDKLEEFSVCGQDGKWYWAYAKIVGNSVIVSSSDVQNPVAARYAWQSNPKATLFNGAGFPAVPFRTDNGAN